MQGDTPNHPLSPHSCGWHPQVFMAPNIPSCDPVGIGFAAGANTYIRADFTNDREQPVWLCHADRWHRSALQGATRTAAAWLPAAQPRARPTWPTRGKTPVRAPKRL